jgi:hypothetical protein
MFPTHADLRFWQARQALPDWARTLREKVTSPSHETIDYVVNEHAKSRPTAGECAASNLLHIVRSMRRRKLDLVQELRRMALQPACAINPEKRAAFARKWADKLEATS